MLVQDYTQRITVLEMAVGKELIARGLTAGSSTEGGLSAELVRELTPQARHEHAHFSHNS